MRLKLRAKNLHKHQTVRFYTEGHAGIGGCTSASAATVSMTAQVRVTLRARSLTRKDCDEAAEELGMAQ